MIAGSRLASARPGHQRANLESADIVLLLVSPDFLASDYCYEREMLRAVERHKAGACTVIPVILRPCDWHDAPFGGLLAAPKDGKPITQWPDIDAAFLDVTTAIKGRLRKRGELPTVRTRGPSPSRSPRWGAPAPIAAAPVTFVSPSDSRSTTKRRFCRTRSSSSRNISRIRCVNWQREIRASRGGSDELMQTASRP